MSTTTPAVDHDWLQSGVIARVDHFVRLSHAYAERGEGRLAQLAVWAADVHVLQTMLWENGLGAAPDPDEQLAAVGHAVTASLADHASATHAPLSPRESVERAREAMVSTFDESVHDSFAERFVPLDHLDELRPPVVETADQSVARRLAGRTPEQLVADLHATAGDCMAVATVMLEEGDRSGALHQAQQADLAAFEAYLVAAAVVVGDEGLVTAELRWDLARAEGLGELPHDVRDVAAVLSELRDRLVGVVGPAEEVALRDCFEPLPVAG